MDESTHTSSAAEPTSVVDDFRTLRRSRSDRVIAGVLGGLGQRLGIDPLVLRVATAVLALFGGAGILLYAVAWLLVPAEDEDASVADQALGRAPQRSPNVKPLAVALAVLAIIAATGVIVGSWDAGMLVVLAVAAIYLAFRQRGSTTSTATPADEAPTDASGAAAAYDPFGTDDPAATTPTEQPEQPLFVHEGWETGPDWNVQEPAYASAGPAEPSIVADEPREPRSRSILGPLTVCTALVALGALAINDGSVHWAAFPVAIYVAVPLAIVGLGLLVGTWFGRSRGLIVLGTVLTLALIPATWASHWDFTQLGTTQTHTYTEVADVPATVTHGAGSVAYDLSGLTLTEGESVPLTIDQDAGQVSVTLPADADVVVNASVGAGNLTVFDDSRGGILESITTVDHGGPGAGRIVLNISLGMGDLEVTR